MQNQSKAAIKKDSKRAHNSSAHHNAKSCRKGLRRGCFSSKPLMRRPTLSFSTGLNLTYAYLTQSDALPATHFLRPGIDLAARFELPLSQSWLISFGWTSLFCPPQKLGGTLTEMGELNESIWHIGQAFAQIHYRFPYRVRL